MSAIIHRFPAMSRTGGMSQFDEWAEWMRARNLADRTIAEQVATVARISESVGVPAAQLTSQDLIAYFATSGPAAASSQATYRVALRAYFKYLILTDLRTDDPTMKLGRLKVPRRKARPITTAHLDAVLASGIRSRTRSMILLASYAGLRVHEIAKIRGEHFDKVTKQLYVLGKGGREDWLPLHSVLNLECRRYPSRGYWFPSYQTPGQPILAKSVSNVISKAMRRCGVVGTPHAFRHWYGTELHRAGLPLRTVQELMRHSNPATTAGYIDVDQSEMADAIARLPRVA